MTDEIRKNRMLSFIKRHIDLLRLKWRLKNGCSDKQRYLLEVALEGKKAWNELRKENPESPIDFSGLDFTQSDFFGLDLSAIDFQGFNFGSNVDFSYTKFGDWNLEEKDNNIRTKGSASFESCSFGDGINFKSARFGNLASFRRASFESVDFSKTAFGKQASFVEVACNSCRFKGAKFGMSASFSGSTINRANFEKSIFGDDARFEITVWSTMPNFSKARFGDHANFSGSSFSALLKYDNGFDKVTFGARADFTGCRSTHFHFPLSKFGPNASFAGMEVEEFLTRFEKRNIGEKFIENLRSNFHRDESMFYRSMKADFSHCEFNGKVSFADREITEFADFRGASFNSPPDFGLDSNYDKIGLSGARFEYSVSDTGKKMEFKNWTTSSRISASWRRLRSIASSKNLQDVERDLFIAERLAERGVLWVQLMRRPSLHNLSTALYSTVISFIYWFLSNFGRSVMLPAVWYMLLQIGSYFYFQMVRVGMVL